VIEPPGEYLLVAVASATPRGRTSWDIVLECGHYRESRQQHWRRLPGKWAGGRDPGRWEKVTPRPPRKVRCYQCVRLLDAEKASGLLTEHEG